MTEKNFYYLIGIALVILLVLFVYLTGRVQDLEAAVFGGGGPGAGDLLGYDYDYDYDDPYYDPQSPAYGYTADVYSSYYGTPSPSYCAGYYDSDGNYYCY